MSDCIFSGKLQSCLFFGRDPDEHNGPPNIFEANDFSEAEFINSDFRWGVDLTRQKLPVGYNVFYSPDATTTITSAQDRASEVIDDKTRKNVFNILEVLAEKIEYGQEQLFVAEKSFTNISWPVLRAVLNGDDPNNPPQPPETTTPQKRAGAKPRTRKSRTRSGAMKPAERPTTEPASLSSASRNDDASNPVIETATRQLADPATLDQAITTLTGILKDPDADSALIDQATATLAALPTDGTSVHLDLANARLGHNATLTGLTITADSTFTGLTASEGLTITSCTFTGKADFTDLTANGPVTITNTTINGPAEFSRAEFNGPAAITRTIFNNYAMFDIATFADTLDLTQTQFWSDLSLEADFQAGVIFNQTMIEGNAKRSIPLELGINDQGLPPGTIWSPSGPFWEE